MKTIRIEILILIALAAAEWFDVIHYFFALLISLIILCAIAITCIVFLFKKKFRLFAYLVALMVENEEEIKERGLEKIWKLENFYCGTRCRGICQFEFRTIYDPKDTILVRIVDYHKGTPLDTLFLVKVKTE